MCFLSLAELCNMCEIESGIAHVEPSRLSSSEASGFVMLRALSTPDITAASLAQPTAFGGAGERLQIYTPAFVSARTA